MGHILDVNRGSGNARPTEWSPNTRLVKPLTRNKGSPYTRKRVISFDFVFYFTVFIAFLALAFDLVRVL